MIATLARTDSRGGALGWSFHPSTHAGTVWNLISVEALPCCFLQSAMTRIRSSMSTKMSTAIQQLDMVSIPLSAPSPANAKSIS